MRLRKKDDDFGYSNPLVLCFYRKNDLPIRISTPKLFQENMGAIIAHTHCVLRFPTLSSHTNQPKLGKPIFSLRGNSFDFMNSKIAFSTSRDTLLELLCF